MNILKNKVLFKLIVSICLCLTIFSIGPSTTVYSANNDEDEVWGSILITPVIQLITGIGDGVIDIIHQVALEQEVSLVKIDGSPDWWTRYGKIVVGILIAIAVAVALWYVASAVITGLVAKGIFTMSGYLVCTIAELAIVTGAVSGYLIVERIDHSAFPQDLYLPIYNITPKEIFANEIPLFDINFFNPMPDKEVIKPSKEAGTEKFYSVLNIYRGEKSTRFINGEPYDEDWSNGIDGTELIFTKKEFCDSNDMYIVIDKLCGVNGTDVDKKVNEFWPFVESRLSDNQTKERIEPLLDEILRDINKCSAEAVAGRSCTEEELEEYKTKILNNLTAYLGIKYINCSELGWGTNPDAAWSGIEGLSYAMGKVEINKYVDGKPIYITAILTVVRDSNSNNEKVYYLESTAAKLSRVVAQWYFTLRNIALLVLMLLLIYSGIRIVIGSTAGEKAKYKERIMDWLTAICLVFVMHYIMVFAVELNEKIIELVKSSTEPSAVQKVVGLGTADGHKYQNAMKSEEFKEFQDLITDDGRGNYYVFWRTDLMGGIRILAQEENEGTAKWVGFSLCFLTLVACTCIFVWTYLKRVVYMAFLTMIAPLVAMTYPIDKITDGKAQAFNSWLKEYIFNLLIQPMHLILYTILISSAYELAATNAIYTIVAIGFMVPAEKLIRKFFGFNKAQTPGILGGAAGAALAMTGLQKIMKFGPKDKGPHDGQEEESTDSNKIKYSSSDGVNPINTAAEDASQEKKSSSGSKGDIAEEQENEDTVGGPIKKMTRNNPTISAKTSEDSTVNINNNAKKDKGTEPKRRGRIRRTIKSVSTAYGRELKRKALKRMKNGRPIRALARGVAGLAGGVGFGMMGLALGIASGDPSKAFQYTTAGAVGGYKAGKGVAGRTVDALSVSKEKMKDEAELSWYDADEYKKAMLDREKKELAENEDYITYIRKTTGASREQAIEILQGTGSKCLDSGIRKVQDITAVYKMQQDLIEDELSKLEQSQELAEGEKRKIDAEMEEKMLRQAISAQKLSDRLPTDIRKMGEKKIEEYRKQFKKELKSKLKSQLIQKGIEKEKAEKLAETQAEVSSKDMMNGIIRFSDAKASLEDA